MLPHMQTKMNAMMPHVTRRRFVGLSAAALAFAGGLGPAFAMSADAVKTFVQDMSDRVIKILDETKDSFPERQKRFRQLFASHADVDAIARFVAGNAWRTADEDAQRDYVDAFTDYIAFTYANRIGSYAGEKLDVFRVIDAGSKGLIVNSRIVRPAAPTVSVDWRLKDRDGALKVIDLIIENVSMSVTQRSEFQGLLANNGGKLGTLAEELRARVRQG